MTSDSASDIQAAPHYDAGVAQLPGRLLIVQSQATVPGRRRPLTAQAPAQAARAETLAHSWDALRFPKIEAGLGLFLLATGYVDADAVGKVVPVRTGTQSGVCEYDRHPRCTSVSEPRMPRCNWYPHRICQCTVGVLLSCKILKLGCAFSVVYR